MSRELDQPTAAEILRRLAELLAVPRSCVRVRREPIAVGGENKRVDLLVAVGNLTFAVEWKASGQASSVAMAIRSLHRVVAESRTNCIPVVAAPFVGEVGQQMCEEARMCWLDLSGNAHLAGPGLRVTIEGKPNRFKRSGRPRSVFAPKSARIARWLLVRSDHAFTQREIAGVAGLDEGFTSRIVRQLEDQRLIARDPGGLVKVADYNALLDAMREAYDFSRHQIVRGHIAARSSEEVLRRVSTQLRRDGVGHAVTGLAGAWLHSGFAGFRLVVVYLGEMLSEAVCREMGFHRVDRGENVWLVRPNDAGVFDGGTEREGISCVHSVQLYLDLKGHPERSAEAAVELRRNVLNPTYA